MRKLVSLTVMLLLTVMAFAQTRTITGKVLDATDGSPLPGVTVAAGNVATQTDVEGNYSIQVPQGVSSLTFTFVGFQSKTITLGTQNVHDVALESGESVLEEVVVTGVGTAVSKKKVAIAVETVGEKDLPRVAQGSLDQALVGKIAGAQISATSGQPGQQASILLRGINTLGNTQPMILVDGVQINAGGNNNGSGNNVSSRLSDLDLSNVERVEVIQGAAAGTIYGAQGANGVIQIFTKRGKKGTRPAISISSRTGFDNALRGNLSFAKRHYFNVDGSGRILDGSGNPIARNENGQWTIPANVVINGETLNNKEYAEQTYDQLGQLFKTNVLTQNTNVNVSGGSESMDYALTFSQLKQNSIVFGALNRYNVSANLGIQLAKGLTFRSITQLVRSDNTTGGITGANNIYSGIGSASLSKRYWDLTYKNPQGYYVSDPENGNSVNPFYTQQFNPLSAENTRIVQNFNLNYKIGKFVELDYKYGIDNYRYDFRDFIKYQAHVLTPGGGIPSLTGSLENNNISETFQNSLLSAFIKTDFEKDFNLNIPITTSTHLAYDWRKKNYYRATASAAGFPAYPPYNLNTGGEKNTSDYREDFITYGYLVNQRIDYGTLFGVSGGVRIDYASTFGGESFKAFVFPRGDVYFNVGNLLNSPAIQMLKLRAAYGSAGTQPGAYDRQITLNTGNVGTGGYLALRSTANNIDLMVQSSYETEFGTDFGLKLATENWLTNLTLSATYWYRTSKDAIRTLDLPPSSGVTGILNNALTLKSNGFQLSLDMDVYNSRNFNWTFGTRFGTSRSIVDEISNGKEIAIGSGGAGQFVLREGQQVSTFYGRRTLHSVDQLNLNGDRYIPEADKGNFEVVNGIVVNKTTKAAQFTTENFEIGNGTPKFNMTFLNTFNLFRNFTIGVQVDWVYGNDIYNQTKQWLYRDLVHGDLDKTINVNGTDGAYVNYYNSLYFTNTNNSYFVEDGSFVRLRDLSLTYDLSSYLSRTFIKNLQFSVSGRNLFTITKYTGIDPEASANFNDPIYRGLDLHSFPNTRNVQVGINLGL